MIFRKDKLRKIFSKRSFATRLQQLGGVLTKAGASGETVASYGKLANIVAPESIPFTEAAMVGSKLTKIVGKSLYNAGSALKHEDTIPVVNFSDAVSLLPFALRNAQVPRPTEIVDPWAEQINVARSYNW